MAEHKRPARTPGRPVVDKPGNPPGWGEPGRQEWERRRFRDALKQIVRITTDPEARFVAKKALAAVHESSTTKEAT
jgi:hypothetical protein